MMDPKQSEVLNLERVQELETWLKTTNTKLTQVNGQRKYGGPPDVWMGSIPGNNCEVFISQIPLDAYEDLLIPLFSLVGPLWEFRLMMNFSGQNRGFAYAKYGSPAIANTAIRLLHGHMLEPGCYLVVRHSTEKRQLCIKDLPGKTKQADLLKVLRALTQGVERVSLRAEPGIEGVSAVVVFLSHYSASMAKKVLVEAFKKQFDLDIIVQWESRMKPNPDKPSKRCLSCVHEPPHHTLNSPQPCVQHPRVARPPPPPLPLPLPPPPPPGFCRAVGGPTSPKHPLPPSSMNSSSCQGHLVATACSASPVTLLQKMCKAAGVGEPVYEIHYSHTESDGFLYFTYQVCIPGISHAFKGGIMTLPGPTATATLEEAWQASAQQVVQRVYNSQFTD
ncbi:dead end protein 1 [Larimichthys crocea]|uniref:dead end protein 1 n=1 Tax=Larimichthys crocea TaxID=215358 RepID=UPI000622FC62|nr:dead end protein 1 [Larimichthys crocea]